MTVIVETDLINESGKRHTVSLVSEIKDKHNKVVGVAKKSVSLAAGASRKVKQKINVDKPTFWHPDTPYLYNLYSSVKKSSKQMVDGFRTQIGIRKIEFRGKDGFYLNNKPFYDKLIGANRHQDYAYVGNALPNSMHWRDVKKLREAGFRIIRSAHYPQDPAFMNACDKLGMFVIVATPGWQFYNKDDIFQQRVYQDIRNMVRRDRNHPSVIMWEPILNETHYPVAFSQKVHTIVHEEYPFQGAYAAADISSRHPETLKIFDVVYSHPLDKYEMKQSVFTREWGDNVDDWSSHNSPSRTPRDWGEAPQLIQALHYAKPSYSYTCLDRLYKTPAQHVGGALWHSFDHQRGYHPDPFWGGVMDVFRQPKYSWFMFRSQRDPEITVPNIENGPMIYIANEMTPFSDNDIVVFTNCDQVRLTVLGKELAIKNAKNREIGIPHPAVIFKDAYHFMDVKKLHRAGKWKQAKIVAEGICDGKVVATATRMPARKKSKIVLKADYQGVPLVADGSDFITVIAYMEDDSGNVKRLNEDEIRFEVSGEGTIIGDRTIGANPRRVQWGTAPALIRANTTPGKIKIIAHPQFEGVNTPGKGELIIESIPSGRPSVYSVLPKDISKQYEVKNDNNTEAVKELKRKLNSALRELNKMKLKAIEKQQEEFE